LAGFSIECGNSTFAAEVLRRGLRRVPHSSELLLEAGLVSALAASSRIAESQFSRQMLPIHTRRRHCCLGVLDLQTGDAKGAAEYFNRANDPAPKGLS
jgi:hypothetical protein